VCAVGHCALFLAVRAAFVTLTATPPSAVRSTVPDRCIVATKMVPGHNIEQDHRPLLVVRRHHRLWRRSLRSIQHCLVYGLCVVSSVQAVLVSRLRGRSSFFIYSSFSVCYLFNVPLESSCNSLWGYTLKIETTYIVCGNIS
jgi:hypothetical protein